jgi:uncharacterized protein YcfJ
MIPRVLTLSATLAALTAMLATPALAGNEKGRAYGHAGPGYEYARVVNVEPIVRQVRVEVPQRECWTEEQYEEPRTAHRGSAGQMILGGIIGGAIGSRFGDGDGRRAATAAGALIGAAIGHDTAERRRAEAQNYEPRVRTVERCGVRYINNYEERVEGYDVEYEYHGQRYHTRMPYDPGERLRIRVDVRPAHDGYRDHDERYDDDRYGDYED